MNASRIVQQSGDPRLSACEITIDLDALKRNYVMLNRLSGKAQAGAAVKADAYGLGLEPVARTLWNAGCRKFFIADIVEGARLRDILPAAEIFLLSGCDNESIANVCVERKVIPVLASLPSIRLWENFNSRRGRRWPCAIMVDTGMNRLGLTFDDAVEFARDNKKNHHVTVIHVMSHLACADEKGHGLNRRQVESFQAVMAQFEDTESSIANSAGILLGGDYHFNVTRPGIALYGGNPTNYEQNRFEPVVTSRARIFQIRQVSAGEPVSYGAATRVARDSVIAVAGAGYADGWQRSISGSGVPLRNVMQAGGCGFVAGKRVPIIGRVTMDQTMFDITDLPTHSVSAGDMIELFGRHIPIDAAAESAGTISYELLSGLSRRAARKYLAAE